MRHIKLFGFAKVSSACGTENTFSLPTVFALLQSVQKYKKTKQKKKQRCSTINDKSVSACRINWQVINATVDHCVSLWFQRCSTALTNSCLHSASHPCTPHFCRRCPLLMHSSSVSTSQILSTFPPSRVSALPLWMNVNLQSSTYNTC